MAIFRKTEKGILTAGAFHEPDGENGFIAGVRGRQALVSFGQDGEGNALATLNRSEISAEGAEVRDVFPEDAVFSGRTCRRQNRDGKIYARGFSSHGVSGIAMGYEGFPPAAAAAFSDGSDAPVVYFCREEAEKQHIAAGTVKAF